MALPALLGAGLKTMGGGLVKGAAKGAATNFIKGKKTEVKPEAVKGEGVEEKKPGALVVRPKTTLVPADAIVPLPAPIQSTSSESGEKTEQDTIFIIREKVFEIVRILRGTLAAEKARSKAERRDLEMQKRKKQETKLEKVTPSKDKKAGKKFNVPGKGLLSGVFDFFKNIFLGWFLVNFIQAGVPGGETFISVIAGGMGFITDLVLGTLDAFGSFLLVGKNALDSSKEWLKENSGDEAENRFNELIGGLTNLFNAAFIVGSVFATLGIGGKGPGKKPTKPTKPTVKPQTKPFGEGKPGMKPTGPSRAAKLMQKKHGHAARGIYENAIDNGKTPKQAKAAVDKALKKGQIVSKPQTGSLGGTDKGSKITKGGLKKVPKRLATKVLGKQGIMAMKGIAKGLSKIPILGPIVVAVSSLLAGEPPGQALFKGLGAALGGFLGTFIPIPVLGTMLGEVLGTFVGDLLYSLILGGGPKEAGDKLMNAIKTALDVGGLIVKFVGDGFKKFINGFFEKDPIEIPDGLGRRVAATKIVEFLGMKDFLKDRGYVDGKDQVTKFPNLMNLINPFSMIGLLGKSFFGAISSASDSSSAIAKGEDDKGEKSGGKAWWDFAGVFSGSSSTGSSSTGPVKTGDLDPNSGASNVSGEAGKFIEQNLESAAVAADGYGDYNRITEHPDFGGVRGRHANGSYHYSGRAIDIGAFTHEQGPIVDVINQFNKKRGVQPAELITGASFPGTTMVDPGGHGDHVHIAYGLGGLVKGITHAMLGEKGEEFVIDNDSYTAIEDTFPGLLNAINKAKGPAAVQALMAYTDYEKPQAPQIIMAGGGSASGYSGGDQGGSTGVIMTSSSGKGSSSGWADIRYKFG